MDLSYTGYKILDLSDKDFTKLYNGTYETEDFKENEYLIGMRDGEACDYFCYRGGALERVKYPTCSSRFENTIKPKNPQQYCAMDLLFDSHSKIKLLRGVYGSGKDFLMLHSAINLLDKGIFNKIIFVRPNISVAGLPDLGALPGSVDEKLAWTLAPLYDKVGGEEGVQYLMSQHQLELVPLNFIRGRSFESSIIYMTEGQNMTTELVKLLIGRVGENSELWINADNHQVDRKIFEEDNGIIRLIQKLSGNPLFGYVYLPTTERSNVARLADLLDEET